MQCQKKKPDGNQCRARARSGQKYCALHAEPGKAAELGSKGGRRRAVYSPDGLQEFTAPEVLPICGICWRSQSLRFVTGSSTPN